MSFVRILPLAALLALLPGASVSRADDNPGGKAKSYQVPYKLTIPKHIVVRAKINGKGPFNLVLDTGAGYELRINRFWSVMTLAGSLFATGLTWFLLMGVGQ